MPACSIQYPTCFGVGILLTSFFASFTSAILAARLSAFLLASSGTVSTPAASRSSAYSPPTPLMRKRSAWFVHFSISFSVIPVFSASLVLPFFQEQLSSSCSDDLMPASFNFCSYESPMPSIMFSFKRNHLQRNCSCNYNSLCRYYIISLS